MTPDQPPPEAPQSETPRPEPVFLPSSGGSYERLPDGSLRLISKTEDAPAPAAAAPQETTPQEGA